MTDDFDDLRSIFREVASIPPDFSGFRSRLFRENGEPHLVSAIDRLRSGHTAEQVRAALARGFPIIGTPPLSVMDHPDTRRGPSARAPTRPGSRSGSVSTRFCVLTIRRQLTQRWTPRPSESTTSRSPSLAGCSPLPPHGSDWRRPCNPTTPMTSSTCSTRHAPHRISPASPPRCTAGRARHSSAAPSKSSHAATPPAPGAGSRPSTHYLRVYMNQLRQKLEADPARPRYLLTETGVGYRLAAEV